MCRYGVGGLYIVRGMYFDHGCTCAIPSHARVMRGSCAGGGVLFINAHLHACRPTCKRARMHAHQKDYQGNDDDNDKGDDDYPPTPMTTTRTIMTTTTTKRNENGDLRQ